MVEIDLYRTIRLYLKTPMGKVKKISTGEAHLFEVTHQQKTGGSMRDGLAMRQRLEFAVDNDHPAPNEGCDGGPVRSAKKRRRFLELS